MSTHEQKRRRVVVAEDEAIIRLDLREMLEEEGYEVMAETVDGKTAVDLAEQHRPDLVILDVKMPVLDGISAASRSRQRESLQWSSSPRSPSASWWSGRATRGRWPTSSSRSPRAIWCRPSRWPSRATEIAQLEAEIAELSERLETSKLVDRAKGVLQTKYGLTEPDAFRWIQKASVDRRLTMREVAQIVIAATGEGRSDHTG